MNVTDLRVQLEEDEGRRATPYRCTAGYWTVGVGHRLPETLALEDIRSLRWTETEIDRKFDQDLAAAIHDAASFGPWITLDEARQGVIVQMCFQMGRQRVAGFTKMWEAIKRRDFHGAAREMLDSRWRRQAPRRCERLAQVMRNGA